MAALTQFPPHATTVSGASESTDDSEPNLEPAFAEPGSVAEVLNRAVAALSRDGGADASSDGKVFNASRYSEDAPEDSKAFRDRQEDEGPLRHRLFDLQQLERLSISSADDTKAVLSRLRKQGEWRELQLVPENYLEICEGLSSTYPNFHDLIEGHLIPQLALCRASTSASIKLSPLLVVGTPGIGKTTFCEALADAFGLPFHRVNLETAQAAFEITGVARGWSSAGPGRIMRWLAQSIPVNGIFVMEELEKTCGDERYDPKSALLQLLEESTAKKFADQSVPELYFDLRPINFLFTANSTRGLSDPLLDRLSVIEIPPLTRDQAKQAACRQYQRILDELGLTSSAPALRDDALDLLSLESPRKQKLLIRLALGRALAYGSPFLSIKSAAVSRSPLGFF